MSKTEDAATTPAGWYDDGSGRERYWDGTVWTEHFSDTYVPSRTKAAAAGNAGSVSALWRRWTTRERWVAIGSVAGTVLGILGLVLPIVFADRVASVSSISVDSQLGDESGLAPTGPLEPVEAGLTARFDGLSVEGKPELMWVVPVDAPWHELFGLPICEIGSGGLTPRSEAAMATVAAWLAQHGEQTPRRSLWAYFSNTAGAGAITVSDIRAQGTLTPAPDRVWVYLGDCFGKGACELLINAEMALGVDPVAVFDDPPLLDSCDPGRFTGVEAYPGDPVVFDISPGRTFPMFLRWTQTEDFTGRFVATVRAGGETSTIDLSPGNSDLTSLAVNVPARLGIGDGGGTFHCSTVDDQFASPSITYSCTLDQWLATVESARRS